MSLNTDNYLLLIQFLDLLCMGIVRPSVPPTLLKSGGTLMHLGILASSSAVTHKIAILLCNEFEKIFGHRKLLKYSVLATTLLNALLLFTPTANGMVLNRTAFAFAYQIPILCGKLEKKDLRKEGIYKNLKIQGLVSVLIGSATVGSFIDGKGGFSVLLIISTSISMVATAIVFQLESSGKQEKQDKKEKEGKPNTSQALTAIKRTFDNVKVSISKVNIDFENWNTLLVKYLLMSHSFIVFILFVVLITIRFGGKGKTVCSVAAYQAIVIATIEPFFEKLNNLVSQKNSRKILEYSSLICAFSAIFASFAPSIQIYCLMFIPLVISRKFVDKYYVEVFEIAKNQKLTADLKTFSFITEVTSPLIIGFLFNILKFHAYRLLSIGTMFGIFCIVKFSLKQPEIVSDKKNKKE